MSHVLAKMKGVKIEDIKKALKADEGKHAEHGLDLEHVWENDDDHGEVQFIFKSTDLAHARKFIGEVHAKARENDPNINLPSMTFLAGEDAVEFELPELPEDEGKEESEDADTKKKEPPAPPANPSSIPLNALAIAASSALIGAALGAGGATLYCPVPEPLPIVQVSEVADVAVKAAPTPTASTGVKGTGVKTPPASTGTGAPAEVIPAETQEPAAPVEEVPPNPDAPTPPEESSGGTIPNSAP